MKIMIQKDFDGFVAGSIKEINISKSMYWRNRLKDAEIDGCVKIVKSTRRGK